MKRIVMLSALSFLLSGCITVNTCCGAVVACGVGTVGQAYDGSGQYSEWDENDGGGQWNQWDGSDNRDHPEFVCVPE